MMLDGRFQLLDIFRSTFSKGCLRLAIPLLSLLGRGINLEHDSVWNGEIAILAHPFPTGFRPPLRFCTWAFSGTKFCSSNSGEVSEKLPSSECSALGAAGTSSTTFAISVIRRVAGTLPT